MSRLFILSAPCSLPSLVRAGDDHSACSSCSSGGLAYELARKCTLSADSLLLHPEISLQSRVSDFKKRSAEEPTTSSRSAPRHHHLQPQTSAQRKMISSLSSDQIHSQLMTHEPIDGTRSASPKLTGKKSTPEPIDELQAAGGTSAQEEKRKGSVASQVFSRPGRLARLLRRTHSAGCSKDIPPYALFLREKSSVCCLSDCASGSHLSHNWLCSHAARITTNRFRICVRIRKEENQETDVSSHG